MKVALFGDDPAMRPLIQAIVDSAQHELTHVVMPAVVENGSTTASATTAQNAEATVAWLASVAPGVCFIPDWEELFNLSELDAVIIAGFSDVVLQAAKQLAVGGKTLFVIPDARQDSAWIYEMTLIHDDTQTVMRPIFPLRDEPVVQQLQAGIAAGRIGKLLHLQWEHEISVADSSVVDSSLETANRTPLLCVDDVNRRLLYDIDLLRAIGGEYHRITALYSGVVDNRLTLATISLAGGADETVPEVAWSARPVFTESRWTLHLIGETGRYTLSSQLGSSELGSSQLGDTERLQLDESQSDVSEVQTSAENKTSAERESAYTKLLQRFETAAEENSVVPNWTDLTRDFELVDATARSIRRRRTIDLHFETASERSQFKTQMTAFGCLLLSLTPMAFILLLALNAMFTIPETVTLVARAVVFAPLFLFLLLQLLLFLARPSSQLSETKLPGTNSSSQPESASITDQSP